jgi:hypothetical protein
MTPIRAIYDNGHLLFPEGNGPEGRMEVVVVFPDKTEPGSNRDKDAGKRFVEKWSGVLEGVDISNWKDQKAEDLMRKGMREDPA